MHQFIIYNQFIVYYLHAIWGQSWTQGNIFLHFNKTLVTVFPLACRLKWFGTYVAHQCYLVQQFLSSCRPFARRLDFRRSLGPPREETLECLSLQPVTRTLKGNKIKNSSS